MPLQTPAFLVCWSLLGLVSKVPEAENTTVSLAVVSLFHAGILQPVITRAQDGDLV